MRLNPAAIERLAGSKMSGEGTANIFKLLAQAALLAPAGASMSFSLGFQQPGDEYQPTDLFPVITLTLVPPSEISTVDGNTVQPDHDAAPGTTSEQPVP
jgi:hypothetical protein